MALPSHSTSAAVSLARCRRARHRTIRACLCARARTERDAIRRYGLMRTLVATFVAAFIAASPARANQTQSDDRYRIQLKLGGPNGGRLIEGSQQRTERLLGKTEAEQESILNDPLPSLRIGNTYAVAVHINDRSGVAVNHAFSGRLEYVSFGCLRVGAGSGERTAWLSSHSCSDQERPSLWIVLLNPQGEPIAHNEYLFRVCSAC